MVEVVVDVVGTETDTQNITVFTFTKLRGQGTEIVYPSSLKFVITLINTRYVAIQAWTPQKRRCDPYNIQTYPYIQRFFQH